MAKKFKFDPVILADCDEGIEVSSKRIDNLTKMLLDAIKNNYIEEASKLSGQILAYMGAIDALTQLKEIQP